MEEQRIINSMPQTYGELEIDFRIRWKYSVRGAPLALFGLSMSARNAQVSLNRIHTDLKSQFNNSIKHQTVEMELWDTLKRFGNNELLTR